MEVPVAFSSRSGSSNTNQHNRSSRKTPATPATVATPSAAFNLRGLTANFLRFHPMPVVFRVHFFLSLCVCVCVFTSYRYRYRYSTCLAATRMWEQYCRGAFTVKSLGIAVTLAHHTHTHTHTHTINRLWIHLSDSSKKCTIRRLVGGTCEGLPMNTKSDNQISQKLA